MRAENLIVNPENRNFMQTVLPLIGDMLRYSLFGSLVGHTKFRLVGALCQTVVEALSLSAHVLEYPLRLGDGVWTAAGIDKYTFHNVSSLNIFSKRNIVNQI